VIPNADITIYNKYVVNRAEAWTRYQVSNVVWQATRMVNRSKPGVIAADSIFIMIPYSQKDSAYRTPLAWQALVTKTGLWTLQEGDVIVRGLISVSTATASLVTYLKEHYDEVVTISSIDAMDEGSPNVQHFELSCK
jgi:hypothetical protein